MLPTRYCRFFPEAHALREHRALRWIGPALHHPRLWHVNRRGIAMGIAIGVFFGFLIPIAQMPAAAGVALLLRANIPAAVGSTLVTNPFTFVPVYYAAHYLGTWMLMHAGLAPVAAGFEPVAAETGVALWMDRLASVGAPVGLGLLTLAVSLSVLSYFSVHWAWRMRIVAAWRQRQSRRKPAR